MCGIVGLFIKDKKLEPDLGALLSEMLGTMCVRGPDSAGFAVYSNGSPQAGIKITFSHLDPQSAQSAIKDIEAHLEYDLRPVRRFNHTTITVRKSDEGFARSTLRNSAGLSVVSVGRRMEVFKDVGCPSDVANSFGLPRMSGSHGIGHTRMATESAVTTRGAHPFSTGVDECLVHNGSLSNHAGLRRKLEHEGLKFETDNDSEVAAGYLTWRMSKGETLGEALKAGLSNLDGFYTFVVGTESGFGVIRDPIACKPAILAETDQYVAFGSEYRALAALPGVANAKLWEPEPATVYFWEHAA
ncbi:glutamine amidotransferase family protein [Bradyrhizobium sp. CCBAU 53421]|uniref:class II glutamine amidotransferase n=1 Tax=Bradyrhizobium sp. CCBAU 53421 TaxID=1325120 RepID=UPI00188BEDC7|nr:glutamine amidotransferase family protein [Bradyrhizobium sp. CCBAU 53421]QOZ36519.1 glutamine amidotransferase [Bradyrhizobium sp. CCBAU 53421]